MLGIIIDSISTFMYSKLLVILLIGAGIYFTIRTKLPQMRLFKDACKAVVEKPEDENGVSSFQALMVSTASRVGTGNIIGVSSAICIGGFGSVFWMWIIAIIGSASALIESTLAQIYKKKGEDGSCYGGPAYYIEAALHCRPLAIVFCVAMILTYAFGFNMLASYNLQSTFSVFSFYEAKISPWIIGGILAVLTGWCLLGGGSRIVKVTSMVVPVMGIAYIGISLLVVIINIQNVPAMFVRIFEEAFDFKAIFGAFSGSAMMQGIRRGLYSNEAGIGSAPNASAAANVSHPVKQGLIQALSVFTDTIVICSCTAFIILLSDLPLDGTLKGIQLTQAAVGHEIGPFGAQFIAFCILLFAFSSIVGNYSYCETNLFFISRHPAGLQIYRIAVGGMVFFGSVAGLDIVWNLADLFMALMTLINLIALIFLGHLALKALKNYNDQKRRGIKSPVFKASDIPEIEDQLSEWK